MQYTVYRNQSASSKDKYPYIIDIQNNLLCDYDTHIIMPITPFKRKTALVKTLNPIININGIHHVVMTNSVTTVAKTKLKKTDAICIVPSIHSDITAAIDLIISGI